MSGAHQDAAGGAMLRAKPVRTPGATSANRTAARRPATKTRAAQPAAATPKPASNQSRVTAPRIETCTWARAHCIGEALDIRKIAKKFGGAVLQEGEPEFVILLTSSRQHLPPNAPPVRESSGVNGAGHSDRAKHEAASGAAATSSWDVDDISQEVPQVSCVAVFDFGAVVFFSSFAPVRDSGAAAALVGLPEHDGSAQSSAHHAPDAVEEQQQAALEAAEKHWLEVLLPYAQGKVKNPPPAEELQLIVSPGLHQVMQRGVNKIKLRNWDRGNLETVSRVMGQSVALDYYTDTVDERLSQMEQMMDRYLQRPAPFAQRLAQAFMLAVRNAFHPKSASDVAEAAAERHEYQLIRGMLLTMKVINRLGVMDKDHTPWESDSHDELWQGLRRYLSIEKRSNQLLQKLSQMKDARSDFIELSTNRVGFTMEILISVLILIEILLNPEAHKIFAWMWDGVKAWIAQP